jgi:hypothetical protein
MSDETLSDRLNRLAKEKKKELEAVNQVRKTQDQVNRFIIENARPAFNGLLELVATRVAAVNSSLQDLPPFEWEPNGAYVKQGNVAAYFTFHQLYVNLGPVSMMISFGREPRGIYADIFSAPPEPERYKLQPAMEQGPDRIVWAGDLGEMSSEVLADFVLTNLTEYYLNHKRP